MPKIYASTAERRLILLLMISVSCLYYLTLELKAVENYNENVRYEQERKRRLADNPQEGAPSFGIYCYNSPPFWEWLYALQFLTNPVGCLLLRKADFKRFAAALFLNSLTFFSFLLWSLATFSILKNIEQIPEMFQTFNHFVLFGSTKPEFFLFFLVGVSFVVQMFVLARFAVGRFQAKISLK